MKIRLIVAFLDHSFFSPHHVLFEQFIFNLQQRVNPESCKAEMMFVEIVTEYSHRLMSLTSSPIKSAKCHVLTHGHKLEEHKDHGEQITNKSHFQLPFQGF
jgi:hypothetical protein